MGDSSSFNPHLVLSTSALPVSCFLALSTSLASPSSPIFLYFVLSCSLFSLSSSIFSSTTLFFLCSIPIFCSSIWDLNHCIGSNKLNSSAMVASVLIPTVDCRTTSQYIKIIHCRNCEYFCRQVVQHTLFLLNLSFVCDKMIMGVV